MKKASLTQLHELFLSELEINLSSEGFDHTVVTDLRKKYSDFGIARTRSRSVLGSMTDFALQLKYIFMEREGPDSSNIIEINQRINRVPMKAIEYKYSIERGYALQFPRGKLASAGCKGILQELLGLPRSKRNVLSWFVGT